MFAMTHEDGAINTAISSNKEKYLSEKYTLPSFVLTDNRDKLEQSYQNIPIKNKKDDYHNSLDREMHKEEFKKVALSQKDNTEIFKSSQDCDNFIKEIINETLVNSAFYQRNLKSFEGMVAYCSYYDKFNGRERRAPLVNVKSIELTLRQSIDNYDIIDKNGEVKKFTKSEINKIISFWIHNPNVNDITNKNIFKNAGFIDYKIYDEKLIFKIEHHKNIVQILNKYKFDFENKDNEKYNEILLILHYYKNKSLRKKHLEALLKNEDFINELIDLEGMDGFGAFSLKWIDEVLKEIKTKDKSYTKALEDLGYFSKYLNMPTYDYLPPLEPTKKDIEWLTDNVSYFKPSHIFYQPMVSPKVKRVISVLRKLVNELIKEYGKIDIIRVETSSDMNSKKEKERITENQTENNKKNTEVEKLIKNSDFSIKVSHKNIEKAKLWKEQQTKCMFSKESITMQEAFDENETEIEHFIPRSVIWINSYKNKILVKKKYNQNKGSQNPIAYLKSINQWESFKNKVEKSSMPFNKKKWLSEEDNINNVMKKEYWQESYLNDTRSSIKSIQKYLNHYLYPNKKMYGKDEKRHIFSVSSRAINELKYIWGIHKVMPKNENDKKDRNTNYHHSLDAFTIALCSSQATNILHNSFIQKENKYKTKAQKEKLSSNLPKSKDGLNVVEYLKNLVKKYENNELYVCPYNKRKTNIKGFKDGNLKIYIKQNPKNKNESILAEMEKINIDKSILIKEVNGFPKDRTDKEILEYIKALQDRLDRVKQHNIIKAIEVYAKELIEIRKNKLLNNKDIKKLIDTLKNSKKEKIINDKIKDEIKIIKNKNDKLDEKLNILKCSFAIKDNKRQIVRTLKLEKQKIEASKADVILFKDKIERLSLSNFKQAKKDKQPFMIKMNEATLNVHLFNSKKGQAIGLNYFSSIANDIKIKINDKFIKEISNKSDFILYKNDIIKVYDTKSSKFEYYIFNGGGSIASSNNKLAVKNINTNNFISEKIEKDGDIKIKESKIKNLTLSDKTNSIISIVKISFFGEICEV